MYYWLHFKNIGKYTYYPEKFQNIKIEIFLFKFAVIDNIWI